MARYLFTACVMALCLAVETAWAAPDSRMQVLVEPDEAQGSTLASLQTNITGAAELALPRLIQRIVPVHSRRNVPGNVKAITLVQRAIPGESGVTVDFQPRRVFAWLKANNIPVITEQPAWHLSVELQSAAGRTMTESAALLEQHAREVAAEDGFVLDDSASGLIVAWHWLDGRTVSLSVRGNTPLGEYAETRTLGSGDPVAQLTPWLDEVLLRARDSYVEPAAVPVADDASSQEPAAIAGAALPVVPPVQDGYLLLKVQRQASLPEQILFEDELRHDRRILDLSLRQVNQDGQQYRLHLKGADDQWLGEWFRRRGMSLTPTIEGWVAQQELPTR
ncbi:hypothetical protein FEF65_03040 [Mariprofundus erugo]|uniref:DUF2066 domain-containing protein n=1 Tax=Mariprofundus erugo TaxID=2528639 RepID=A0A5R9GSW4_9PROT|nr:hypothetical protein [Mariprofundus erugo]TLS68688.1 hypothetical protein FEF65_03040 [Mariprofundus erugo]